MAHIYPDSKTFVDKKLKFSPGKIIKKFEELLKNNDGQKLDEEQIREVKHLARLFFHLRTHILQILEDEITILPRGTDQFHAFSFPHAKISFSANISEIMLGALFTILPKKITRSHGRFRFIKRV